MSSPSTPFAVIDSSAAPAPEAVVAPRLTWRATDVLAFALAVLAALGAKVGWLPELPW